MNSKYYRKSGFTLVEVMIVIGIIALLAAIAVPNLLRARVNANTTTAQTALKTISEALESYAAANTSYPTSFNSLLAATPPYLNKDYFAAPYNGYAFAGTPGSYTYTITATPQSANTGSASFTISTGGVLVQN